MPPWFWAASGLIAAVYSVGALLATVEDLLPRSMRDPYLFIAPMICFIGFVYLTCWTWSHL